MIDVTTTESHLAGGSSLGIIGYRRPELLATPEWLAENIARPGFQVLDARWRPDGSGRRVYAAGHIPGASYLDWRTDLVEPDDESELLLLAGPRI
jgi:3-mercaptopyruvate sulfurtransferase SseA